MAKGINAEQHAREIAPTYANVPGYQAPQQPIPVIPQYNPLAELEKLKQAQMTGVIGRLDTAKNNALSGVTTRRNAVEPTYTGLKNTRATESQISAKNFAEYMTQRGSGSGTNAQAALLKNIALKNQMSNIDLAKNQELQGLAQNEADINTNYNSDLVSAQSGIEANALQQSMSAMQQQQQQAIEQQRYQQTLAQQQKAFEANQIQQNLDNDYKAKMFENTLKEQEFDKWLKQEQLKLSQAKASNTGTKSTGSNSSSGTQASNNEKANKTYDALAANSLGDAYNWITEYGSQVESDIGTTNYRKLLGKMNNALTKTGQQYGRGGYAPEGDDPALRYMGY